MSSGTQLQEMEVGTKQSKTAVNANAKPAQPMEKLPGATWDDLGGPTPDNYSPTNDSAKLKDPAGPLKKVADAITNRKGKTLKQGDEAEVADDQEIVAEEPATEVEEVVAEEEVTPSSQRVVGITTGSTTLIDFPEGTGSPFVVGSRVNLTVTDQSYYDDAVGFATVSKVWDGAGRNGYFSTRITVDANTSGIVTAYSSDNYSELRSSFKVSALSKGGAVTGKSTLYYQQVQISGEG